MRSSWTYSGRESGRVERDRRVSDDGGILFLASTENESATSALHYVAIDLIPEPDEVIGGGNQRESDHDPDGKPCDDVNRKIVRMKKRPRLPAMIQDHSDHGYDLGKHFQFSKVTGLDGESF